MNQNDLDTTLSPALVAQIAENRRKLAPVVARLTAARDRNFRSSWPQMLEYLQQQRVLRTADRKYGAVATVSRYIGIIQNELFDVYEQKDRPF